MITNVIAPAQSAAPETPPPAAEPRTPPIDAPLLKIAIPVARSRCGNHSAITFAAPGQLPASPSPRKNEHTAKLQKPTISECAIAAAHHTTIETLKPMRAPNLS